MVKKTKNTKKSDDKSIDVTESSGDVYYDLDVESKPAKDIPPNYDQYWSKR